MIWESNGQQFEDCAVIFKVHDEFGELSNMHNGFPLKVGKLHVKSSEALYQAFRFPHQLDWQREILDAKQSMGAKMKAKKDGRRKAHSRSSLATTCSSKRRRMRSCWGGSRKLWRKRKRHSSPARLPVASKPSQPTCTR